MMTTYVDRMDKQLTEENEVVSPQNEHKIKILQATETNRNCSIKSDEDTTTRVFQISEDVAKKKRLSEKELIIQNENCQITSAKNLAHNPSGVDQAFKEIKKKESLRNFILKKREMFFVEMEVNTRKSEIMKLHEKAVRKELVLQENETSLETDIKKFEDFLNNSNKEAQISMQHVEELARIKQQKFQQIKQLREKIGSIQVEIQRSKLQIEESMNYKDFLEKLTPPEWYENQKVEIDNRVAARRRVYATKKLEEFRKNIQQEIENIDTEYRKMIKELEEKRKKMAGKTLSEARQEIETKFERRKKAIRKKLPTLSELEKEFVDEEQEEPLLYFTDPKQLQDIFRQLEEQNLFLIRNTQENEEAAEEAEKKFHETQDILQSRVDSMSSNIIHLQNHLHQQKNICHDLEKAIRKKTNESEKRIMLNQLTKKILEVYHICGLENEPSTDALQMLEKIEAYMEELMTSLNKYQLENREMVSRLEKAKERERRDRFRQEKLCEQKLKDEEKLKISLRRAYEPVKRKYGKQIMFRSRPPCPQKKDNEESVDRIHVGNEYFLFFEKNPPNEVDDDRKKTVNDTFLI